MAAIHKEDATRAEIEEMDRKVRDLVNYLAKYDNPKYRQLSKIKNPKGVLVLVQYEKKFERGLAFGTVLSAVGSFNPVSIAAAVVDWLTTSEEMAMLGKEII